MSTWSAVKLPRPYQQACPPTHCWWTSSTCSRSSRWLALAGPSPAPQKRGTEIFLMMPLKIKMMPVGHHHHHHIHVHLVASSGRGLASHKGKEFVWSTQASIGRFQAPSKRNILVIQITDTKKYIQTWNLSRPSRPAVV